MGRLPQFAVLQKDPVGPTADQLKRVFKAFSHLTDADAVRVAVGARGILMRNLGRDAARALQKVFLAEGIEVAVIGESDLPELPEGNSLHRLAIFPQAFVVYDLRGRRTSIPWPEIALVAAGAAQHHELTQGTGGRTASGFQREQGARREEARIAPHRIEPDPRFLLEILLQDGAVRYQLDAAKFTFRYVIDRPGLALEEKFIWLVREICRQANRAMLNTGARRLVEGGETVRPYFDRQTLADEIIWLLWQQARGAR
jgi:hypothetical protein